MFKKILSWLIPSNLPEITGREPWLRTSMIAVANIFNEKDSRNWHMFVPFIQDATDAERKWYGEEISKGMMRVAGANNKIIACREWMLFSVKENAVRRVLFLSQNEVKEEVLGLVYLPCVTGELAAHAEQLCMTHFSNECSAATPGFSPLDAVKTVNMWFSFQLQIAYMVGASLPEWKRFDHQWHLRAIGTYSAIAEHTYRNELGLPPVTTSDSLAEEVNLFESNLLAGIENPYDGVTVARPR